MGKLMGKEITFDGTILEGIPVRKDSLTSYLDGEYELSFIRLTGDNAEQAYIRLSMAPGLHRKKSGGNQQLVTFAYSSARVLSQDIVAVYMCHSKAVQVYLASLRRYELDRREGTLRV